MIGSKVFDYEITRKIKAGGMGVVFEGRRMWGRHERVAIKFLLENLRDDPRIRQRFLREAEILETLHHPAIVRILGLDTERDAFIMEYVEGPTLGDYLTHYPKAFHDPAKAVAFFSQILAAFDYAHQMKVELDGRIEQGVIHRDIKPGNIIIQANDVPKILDFGISRIASFGSTLTDPNLPMGSIAYMSPEQIVDSASVDWRSDIYVLGVNLWELFVGQSPYPKVTNFERAVEVQNLIRREALTPLTELVGDATPELKLFLRRVDRIIAKATAKEPIDRYQSCAEMSLDLQATLLPETPEETAALNAPTPAATLSELPEAATIIQRSTPPALPVEPVSKAKPDKTAKAVPPPPVVPPPVTALKAEPIQEEASVTDNSSDIRPPVALSTQKPWQRKRVIYASVAAVAVVVVGMLWSRSVTNSEASDNQARQAALVAKAAKAAKQKAYADSCYQIGQNYYLGNGIAQDYKKAVEWYNKSAAAGNTDGQNDLGYMYQLGYGVPQNDTIATMWYRKSADQGNANGQNSLGFMYANGLSVKQDFQQATQWYQKAADQGNPDGQNNLGTLYFTGQGVAQDYTQAANFYRKSADQGNKEAQFNLGTMYQFGQGVELDLVRAEKWYRASAKQGYPSARKALRALNSNP